MNEQSSLLIKDISQRSQIIARELTTTLILFVMCCTHPVYSTSDQESTDPKGHTTNSCVYFYKTTMRDTIHLPRMCRCRRPRGCNTQETQDVYIRQDLGEVIITPSFESDCGCDEDSLSFDGKIYLEPTQITIEDNSIIIQDDSCNLTKISQIFCDEAGIYYLAQ